MLMQKKVSSPGFKAWLRLFAFLSGGGFSVLVDVFWAQVHQICENTFTVTSHLIIRFPFTCSVFMRANNIPFPPRTLRLAEGKKDGRQTAGLGGKGVSARELKLERMRERRGKEGMETDKPNSRGMGSKSLCDK